MNYIILTEMEYACDEEVFKPHHKVLINVEEIAIIDENRESNTSKIWFKRDDKSVVVAESFNTIQNLLKGPQHYVPNNLDEDL